MSSGWNTYCGFPAAQCQTSKNKLKYMQHKDLITANSISPTQEIVHTSTHDK